MTNPNVRGSGVVTIIALLAVSLAFAGDFKVSRLETDLEYRQALTAEKASADPMSYNGRLLIYMVEVESPRWFDENGEPFHNAFLDFALDSSFTLADGATLSKTVIWDADAAGYGDVVPDNIKAIAVLKDMSVSYPANSDTGVGTAYPFDAYYVDAAAAATVDNQWFNVVSDDFTHSVFIDEGSTTWCPNCPNVNLSLLNASTLYDYPFFYAAMVVDMNTVAANYVVSQYNLHFVPTQYFDGGQIVAIGGGVGTAMIASYVESCGSRVVPSFGLKVDLNWLGKGSAQVRVDMAENERPNTPDLPSGDADGGINVTYDFNSSSTDPDGNQLYYRFDWGDGEISPWSGPYDSGEPVIGSHSWTNSSVYDVKVQARDDWGFESGWSDAHQINIHSYVAGDADASGGVNILDATYIINYLYKNGPPPSSYEAADADGSGSRNILDAGYIINYLYKDGPPPVYT
jgi:hypothetical protein